MARQAYVSTLAARGFAVPEAYVRLERMGLLRFGESREDWEANYQEICLTRPPALVCVRSDRAVEWLSPEEMLDWEAPSHWRKLGLLAFAGNGYGDLWCWHPGLDTGSGAPVVLCRHDENQTEVFANDFEAFLYRSLLEVLTYVAEDDVMADFDGTPETYLRYLRANVEVLRPYLREAWASTLGSVMEGPLTLQTSAQLGAYFSLLSEVEATEILRPDVLVGSVGTTFEHMVP
jgi:hypothetical protein